MVGKEAHGCLSVLEAMLPALNWITLQKERSCQLVGHCLGLSVDKRNRISRYWYSRYLHRGPMVRSPMHRTTG